MTDFAASGHPRDVYLKKKKKKQKNPTQHWQKADKAKQASPISH